MNTWLLRKISTTQDTLERQLQRLNKDSLFIMFLLLSLLLIYHTQPRLFDLISTVLSDAYLGVSVFVAATLAIFYLLDRRLNTSISEQLNRYQALQVPSAALLGALPGCGGAIIVVTQFVNGKLSFGALVAVLISTMGDAAFLLLAQKPDIALLVYGVSLLSGIVFGYLINIFHIQYENNGSLTEPSMDKIPRLPSNLCHFFVLLLIPGTVFGLLEACQFDSNQLFGEWAVMEPIKWLGFLGALLCIVVWISQPLDSWSARFAAKSEIRYLKETVVAETSFVSLWVILGFLSYELLVYFTGLQLQDLFQGYGGYAVFFAILVGLIPGCGPQIVMTTLYINGVVPLSAQLANAISNDGDALFPALALSPKAALLATIYSAIPAFIVGYIVFFLGG